MSSIKRVIRTRSTKAIDTATEAAITTESLDDAVVRIEGYKGTSADLGKHVDKLADIRSLLQNVRSQRDLQTPVVASALASVKGLMGTLVQISKKGSLDQITNIMEKVDQEAIILRRQLPGDVSTASDNKMNGGFQNNAPIGGQLSEGRMTSEAMRNQAENCMQINAPVYGDPSVLVELSKLRLSGGKN